MNASNKEDKANSEAEQAFQAFNKAVKEKSPKSHMLATLSLTKLMNLFVATQTEKDEKILDLIRSFILTQKENNQKTANALVKIVVMLLVIIVVLLLIIFKEQVVSYFTNGIALYNKITPDQKFSLIYVIPFTAIITWFFSRRKGKG